MNYAFDKNLSINQLSRYIFVFLSLFLVETSLSSQELKKVSTSTELEDILIQCNTQNKLLFVYARVSGIDDCEVCDEIENKALKDERITELINSNALAISIDLAEDQLSKAYSDYMPDSYNMGGLLQLIDPTTNVLLATSGGKAPKRSTESMVRLLNEGLESKIWFDEVMNRDFSNLSGADALALYQEAQKKDIHERMVFNVANKVANDLNTQLWTDEGHGITLQLFNAENIENPNFQYLINNRELIEKTQGQSAWGNFIIRAIEIQSQRSINLKDIKLTDYVIEKLYPLIDLPNDKFNDRVFNTYSMFYYQSQNANSYLEYISEFKDKEYYNPIVRSFIEDGFSNNEGYEKSFYTEILKIYQEIGLGDNISTFYNTIGKIRTQAGNSSAYEKTLEAYLKYLDSIAKKQNEFQTEMKQLMEKEGRTPFIRGAIEKIIAIYKEESSIEKDEKFYSNLTQLYNQIGDHKSGRAYLLKNLEESAKKDNQ
ncbi:hypothetical protein [Roseivirga misakiensis]|uniref:Uncharacterized protein n=1 Tax=Roseivirga misakiensis TaxID=1563681 RepID=A0A1E5T3I2_9BACT|nr:hypothetical protein [Roseivirga misakiensis]OEK05932.1 hypothetical protein BFP71_07415 [Roseivirga misakiensis]